MPINRIERILLISLFLFSVSQAQLANYFSFINQPGALKMKNSIGSGKSEGGFFFHQADYEYYTSDLKGLYFNYFHEEKIFAGALLNYASMDPVYDGTLKGWCDPLFWVGLSQGRYYGMFFFTLDAGEKKIGENRRNFGLSLGINNIKEKIRFHSSVDFMFYQRKVNERYDYDDSDYYGDIVMTQWASLSLIQYLDLKGEASVSARQGFSVAAAGIVLNKEAFSLEMKGGRGYNHSSPDWFLTISGGYGF